MTSVIIPPVDLAPGMPSRVVTISATDVTEGGQSQAGQKVVFALSDTLDVTSGGDVIAKTQATVTLDTDGNGSIRLPVYDEDVRTWCGREWAILVSGLGSQKAIRVPAGTSSIALSALPPVRPLRGREKLWAITGVSASVVEGGSWGVTVGLNGGVLDFDFTVPPGGTAWSRGLLGDGIDLNSLSNRADSGVYGVSSYYSHPNRPFAGHGVLEVKVANYGGYQEATEYATGATWRRDITNYATTPPMWGAWRRTDLSPLERGVLADATDLNSLNSEKQTGLYGLSASRTYPNIPPLAAGARATLEVYIAVSTGGYQELTYSGLHWRWRREMENYYASPPTWREWRRVDVDRDDLPTVVQVVEGQSFDDIRTEGEYHVDDWYIAQEVTGWPADTDPSSARLTVRMNTFGVGFQTLRVYGDNGGAWERRTANVRDTPFPWTTWRKLDPAPVTGGGAASSGRNRLLVEDFSRRHGGYWKTGGKCAVSFRLDHGLNKLRDVVLPMTRAAGLRVSIAMNSRNLHYGENNLVTVQEVDAWVAAGDAEIWNHGATHQDRDTEEAMYDELVTGLAELRTFLPSAQIDGFVIPGVGNGADGYLGFGGGSSTAAFYDTFAGRMILDHHAVSTGAIPGTEARILDGTVRQGMNHYGLDSRPAAEAIAKIDQAIADGTGLQLMMHPSVVDTPDYTTAANLQAILDYVVQRRDAGDLVTCSPYEMMLADSRD